MALSQVLAPQLQQSLALLQAPTLELKALVEQELQQNPVLEEMPITDIEQEDKTVREKEDGTEVSDPTEPPADVTYDPATEKNDGEPVDDFQAEFEKLAQMDQEWRDHFSQTNAPLRQSAEDEERREHMFNSIVAQTSLQESLLEQVRTSTMPEDQYQIAELIIGNIDDYGFLQSSVDELAFSTNIPAATITNVLKVIQAFQPPGVGARDLRECLLLQLDRSGMEKSIEYRIISEHMEALGKRRFPEIARGLGIGVEQVQEAVERISHLEPRPGRAYLPDNQQYIVPEVFVANTGKLRTDELANAIEERLDIEFYEADDYLKSIVKDAISSLKVQYDYDRALESLKRLAALNGLTPEQQQVLKPCISLVQNNDLIISTNNDQVPHLRISNTYKDIMSQADSSAEAREWIREKIRAGKFLIKSLHQRQQTIVNIAREIVKRQRQFMEMGVACLKPMTMVQVAEVVGVHETTVSRAVSGKYIETPQGVFEMKYFFTSGIKTASGVGMSNTSVKDIILEMVKKEDTANPLSDETIVKMLAQKEIVIARRTVAKYRAELNILPSNLRKVY